MANLTRKQQQIYDYILAFTSENGYPPSVREIAAAVGLKSPSTVHFHMKGLEEAGMIVKAEGKTRAISLPKMKMECWLSMKKTFKRLLPHVLNKWQSKQPLVMSSNLDRHRKMVKLLL